MGEWEIWEMGEWSGRKGEREKGRKGEREKGRKGEGEKGRRVMMSRVRGRSGEKVTFVSFCDFFVVQKKIPRFKLIKYMAYEWS